MWWFLLASFGIVLLDALVDFAEGHFQAIADLNKGSEVPGADDRWAKFQGVSVAFGTIGLVTTFAQTLAITGFAVLLLTRWGLI
jgi:hypothetical protein